MNEKNFLRITFIVFLGIVAGGIGFLSFKDVSPEQEQISKTINLDAKLKR